MSKYLSMLSDIRWAIGTRLSPLAKMLLSLTIEDAPLATHEITPEVLVAQPPRLFRWLWSAGEKKLLSTVPLFVKAVIGGHIEVLRIILFELGNGPTLDISTFFYAIRGAAKKRYIEVLKLCKQWKPGWDPSCILLLTAASEGDIELAKRCKKWGSSDWNRDVYMAAEVATIYGQVDVIKLFDSWKPVLSGWQATQLINTADQYQRPAIRAICSSWETTE